MAFVAESAPPRIPPPRVPPPIPAPPIPTLTVVAFAWGASDATVDDYQLLYGLTSGGAYPYSVDAGDALTISVSFTTGSGPYFVVCVAISPTEGTSGYSNEVEVSP